MHRTILMLMIAIAAIPLPAATVAPDRVYDVDVTGLSCAVCRKAVKEILLKLPKVKSVDYDLKCYKCYVTMEGDASLTFAQVDEVFRPSKYIFRNITECKNPPKLGGSASGS